MKAKLVIFDWDGTLSDSLSRIAGCVRLAAADIALPLPEVDEVKEIVGLSLTMAIAQLFPKISAQEADALKQGYSRHYRIQDEQPCPFFPTTLATLTELREQGYLLAVATGKSRQGLDRVLSRLELADFFYASRCADETNSKPDPLMLNELLEEFRLKPEEAIMVGDTEFDMEMALNASVPRIAVNYGAHSVDRLQAFKPIACLSKISEIKKFV